MKSMGTAVHVLAMKNESWHLTYIAWYDLSVKSKNCYIAEVIIQIELIGKKKGSVKGFTSPFLTLMMKSVM